jgi:hypothetical protein
MSGIQKARVEIFVFDVLALVLYLAPDQRVQQQAQTTDDYLACQRRGRCKQCAFVVSKNIQKLVQLQSCVTATRLSLQS